MAGNPLPVSFQEMDAFFRVYGIRRLEDRMPYVAAIQAMDAALINHMRKAPAPAPKSPSRPPDPRAPAAQAAAQVRSSAPVSWPTINPTAGEIPVTSSGRRPTEDNPSSPAWPF